MKSENLDAACYELFSFPLFVLLLAHVNDYRFSYDTQCQDKL